jgi:hypothetical protein
MRLIFICILLLSAAVVPYPASAEKAVTIDELVKMYDIGPCAKCHVDKYEAWKTSTMGNSVIDTRVLYGMRAFIRLAIDEEKSLKREDLTICLNCHVPQIKDATPELVVHIGDLILTAVEDKDDAKRESAKKELSKLNINCLVCHNLKAMGFDVKPGDWVIYGPEDLKYNPHVSIGFSTKKSDLIETSEFCAVCHHCPPDVPWKECPTLYTTYIDDFVKKGHKETCQDCHMNGEEKVHKFYGPNNLDYLKSAVDLSLEARPTRYIDIYRDKKIPAVVITINLKNKAGHVIPSGCAFTPKMKMYITLKDQNDREIFSQQKEFTVGDLHFKSDKQVPMAEWDVTATEHFDLGIEPDKPYTSTFIIPLDIDTKSVDAEVILKYFYSQDKIFTVEDVSRKVLIEE